VIAGLTMAGPIQRLTDEHLNDSIPKVKRAGLEISEKLGYLKR
jgi:DNA-binding IclR family transcriptional regulator